MALKFRMIGNGQYGYAWTWKDEGNKVAEIPTNTIVTYITEIEGYVQIEKLPFGAFTPYPATAGAKAWYVRRSEIVPADDVVPEPPDEDEPELPEDFDITAEDCVAFVRVARYILGG